MAPFDKYAVGSRIPINPVAERLETIASKTGVREREMAELLGTTPQTIHRWRKAEADPQSAYLRRIVDLAFAAEELGEFYTPDQVRVRLYSRNRLLGGRRPVDLISQGEMEPVLQVIAILKDGAYA